MRKSVLVCASECFQAHFLPAAVVTRVTMVVVLVAARVLVRRVRIFGTANAFSRHSVHVICSPTTQRIVFKFSIFYSILRL